MEQQGEKMGDAPPPYAPGVPYPPQQPQPGYGYPPQQAPGVGYPPPPGAVYPPLPQQPPAGAEYPPQQQAMVHSTPQQQGTQMIMVQTAVNTCPKCQVGVLIDDFTFLGICCAILFFPLGLLCCFLMRERRCTNCGASYQL